MSNLVVSFEDTRPLALKVAKALRSEYSTISSGDFPDGELDLALDKDPKGKNVIIISSMAHEPNKKMIKTILAGGIAKDYGAKKLILIATYFPYIRQDTHFLRYDSFSFRYIAKLFSFFDKVVIVDPHLHRIKDLKKVASNFSHVTSDSLISDYIKKRFKDDFTLVGPDEESSQWVKPIAKTLHEKVVVLKKHRYSSTKIKQREDRTETFKNNVILVDDIISTGKTAAGALELARRHGAKKLFFIGIHGILAGNSAGLIKKYGELITTNTVPSRYSKIDVSPAIISGLRKLL